MSDEKVRVSGYGAVLGFLTGVGLGLIWLNILGVFAIIVFGCIGGVIGGLLEYYKAKKKAEEAEETVEELKEEYG